MSKDVWTLDVFRRAYALSLDVHRAAQDFPRTEQYGGVAEQLRRASKSICALLVEGGGRQANSDAEFRRYVVMALGSDDEAKLWCAYARDLGFADMRTSGAWQAAFEEIARMLQGLLRKLTADLAKSDH